MEESAIMIDDLLPPASGPAPSLFPEWMTPEQRAELERWWNAPVHPKRVEAHQAFLRDLPELVEAHYKHWVAYHGARRLGIHKSKLALLRKWRRAGIPDEELSTFGIDRSR